MKTEAEASARAPEASGPAAAPAWQPPAELGDYVLLRPLGSGGNGSVWLAEDAVLARQVAIKFAGGGALDAAARQRFVVEARATARVQHPNVVAIHHVGEVDGRPYLVTELVRGRTLDRVGLPLPWREALGVGVGLARALGAAHRSGVLHGDLKPGNAVLTEDGTAKLLDFGLATLLRTAVDGAEGALARPEGLSGTPHYLAPELWRGEAPSRRSDVYALGSLLYELRAGHPPFQRGAAAGAPEDLPQAVQREEAPPLPADGDDAVAARYAGLVARCLRRDPAERPASGDEVREALEEVARAGAAPPSPAGNPYRGLRAFQAGHRALFFGRAAEVGVAVDRLRVDPFVLVTGDSGVGKSSLCRAGVVPAVLEGALGDGRRWSAVTAVPGNSPVASLCQALAPWLGAEPAAGSLDRLPLSLAIPPGGEGRASGGSAAALLASVRAEPASLARAVGRRLGPERGLLLLIDQLEELITLAPPDEAALADEALAALQAVPGVRVLATLRADFLARFSRLPRLAEDLSRVLYFLRPLSPERIREVILGPARATGTRFESEALVQTLVDATASAEGGLPLLQFALAELWERRDPATDTITQAALDAAGGVSGALARHADAVLTGLPPERRALARRMLLRLVTLEGTRARRSGSELATGPAEQSTLDALVRARLLVAQEGAEGSAYELAHEVLLQGWGSLRGWLHEEAERRAQRESLARQAAEWGRRDRSREALLGRQQLREVTTLRAEDLTPLEQELIATSRRAAGRRRALLMALSAAAPLLALVIWAAAASSAREETALRVEAHFAAGRAALARAEAQRGLAEAARGDAFARFDRRAPDAEAVWARAQEAADRADHEYAAAGRALEAAVALAPGRASLRDELGDALLARALLADAWHRDERRDELEQRLSLYDADGSRLRRWNAPASLALRTEPPGAEVELSPAPGSGREGTPTALGRTPLTAAEVAPGSWVLTLRAPGRAPVTFPLQAGRGEQLSLDLALPLPADVPPGFVHVPRGRFLLGSSVDDDLRRGFLNAQPLRPAFTQAFLVSRHEITYGDWIAWLDTLSPAERDLRRPFVSSGPGTPGAVELTGGPGAWELFLKPGKVELRARLGERVSHPGRPGEAPVDWRAWPVTGISPEAFEAYAAWMRATGRVPGARPCSELEWERAARGADARLYPHGDALALGDASYDLTHGQEGVGPDPVGSHPRSRSPFGIDDASGNAFEFTRGVDPGTWVARGGSYWHDRKSAQLANREVVTSTLRDAALGARLCASPPDSASRGQPSHE